MKKINFGTDGWRGIIADDFVYENIELFGWALISFVKEKLGNQRGVIIGFDSRFNSKETANQLANIFLDSGIDTYLVTEPTPTPVVTNEVISRGCDLGIIITASHNDYKWNGIKLRGSTGISLSKEELSYIESNISIKKSKEISEKYARNIKGLLTEISPKEGYLEDLREKLQISEISNSDKRILVDNMFGTTINYIENLFDVSGSPIVVDAINNYVNPIFPGIKRPEPIKENLEKLSERIKKESYALGLAFDLDGDRVGIVDENGDILETYEIYLLLLYYFLEYRKQKLPIVKSLSVSNTISDLASHYHVPVIETPVGFKYLSKHLITNKIMIAGEESGGFGFQDFKDRDAIVSSVFILNLVVESGLSISSILDNIKKITGDTFISRKDIDFNPDKREKLLQSLENITPADIYDFGLSFIDEKDGKKFSYNDGSWILIRISGTENVLRIYAESKIEETLKSMISNLIDNIELI
tara:strand:- start:11823 stop:13244 length:1422 start_codon:yes stop_codon:yes gene_type:complete